MNSKTLAILPLIAMVFTIGLVSSVQASNWEIETTFAGDGSGIGNVSENPAVAERAILRPNSYGNFQSPAQTVCGDHICASGEGAPVLSDRGYYGGYTERKHIDTL